MSNPTRPLLLRNDTIFGVCQGIGEDFGFNPLYLRVLFAGLLLWNPEAILAAYATLGVAVLLSRLAFPARRRVADPAVIRHHAPEDEPVSIAA